MKLIALLSLLFTFNSFANEALPELDQAECRTACHSVSHTYQRHGSFSICHDVMSCRVLEWNEDMNVCEYVKTETRKYPIQCRDIPPAW